MATNSALYNESVNYLYCLQKHGIKLGLENPGRLMDVLGEPQKFFCSVHIAGTNGKGSTAAILASILKESGLTVGLFTSPHLISFTERIKINSLPISEYDVMRLTSYIRKRIKDTDINPTFFEFVTAMAFYYFACEKVDLAVVETGMGGRLDATNILLPEASIVTNVGIDHREFLGKTVSHIAAEKAGILKPSIPVITAVTHPDALSVIKKTAEDIGSELFIYDQDFKGSLISMDDKHIEFDYLEHKTSAVYIGFRRKYRNLSMPLSGEYQVYNASLAIKTCDVLAGKGFILSEDTLKRGLLKVNLEGRLEQVNETPPVIIDSAHNPEASRALADTVKTVFPAKKVILIAGIMKDKDIKGILKPLLQISDTVILTRSKGERPSPPEELKESVIALAKKSRKGIMPDTLLTAMNVAEAIKLAKTLWHKENIILVTGSFYITGEAKEILSPGTGVLSDLRE